MVDAGALGRVGEPFAMDLEPGKVREFARATRSANPAYLDDPAPVSRGEPGARSSLNKLYWSELDISLHETALELLGDEAELDSAWSRGFMFSLAGPIYAGTNEIQRNIVAERLLGLPRA
jgi:alkylation response protein AidB-like acyl-CoA dehydrogenase